MFPPVGCVRPVQLPARTARSDFSDCRIRPLSVPALPVHDPPVIPCRPLSPPLSPLCRWVAAFAYYGIIMLSSQLSAISRAAALSPPGGAGGSGGDGSGGDGSGGGGAGEALPLCTGDGGGLRLPDRSFLDLLVAASAEASLQIAVEGGGRTVARYLPSTLLCAPGPQDLSSPPCLSPHPGPLSAIPAGHRGDLDAHAGPGRGGVAGGHCPGTGAAHTVAASGGGAAAAVSLLLQVWKLLVPACVWWGEGGAHACMSGHASACLQYDAGIAPALEEEVAGTGMEGTWCFLECHLE